MSQTQSDNPHQADNNTIQGDLYGVPCIFVTLLLLFVVLFFQTVSSLFTTWIEAETYTHGLIVFPMAMWMAWGKRTQWSRLPITPCYLALVPLVLACCLWGLGSLGSVQVVQHFAIILMFVCAFTTLVGYPVVKSILFPVLFLFFAVPMGQALVPILMAYTAEALHWLLQLTGIPVYRDGMFFSLPSGNWSVAEACSGIRYLIASFCLGCLFAYLNYHSTFKRLLFVLLSILVPIIANGLRAFLIVMLGHWSNMTLAVGVDHLIYGWLFFGVVMCVLFVVGARWQDSSSETDETKAISPTPMFSNAARFPLILGVGLVMFVLLLWPVWLNYSDGKGRATHDVALFADSATIRMSHWEPSENSSWKWQPTMLNADASYHQAFVHEGISDSGEPEQHKNVVVDSYYFSDQRQGHEVVNAGNRLHNGEFPQWRLVRSRLVTANISNLPSFDMTEAVMTTGGRSLLVWQWYQIGRHFTANHYRAKWYEVTEKLLRGDGRAVVYTFSTQIEGDVNARGVEVARGSLRDFTEQWFSLPLIRSGMAMEGEQ